MKNRVKSWKKAFYTIEPNRVEFGMAIIICVLIYFTMYYADNRDIFHVAFLTNEELFAGRSVNFLGVMTHPYGLVHQWICQIWILPVNLLVHLFEFDFLNPYTFLWCKLSIIVFGTCCIKEIKGIAKTVGIEEKNVKWMLFLLITTILVTLPVFHVAQTDCMYLWLMLMGFHALLKRDIRKFVLWFALANSFKMISLFIFIPLVLLEEKKIMYVLRNLIIGGAIIPAQHLWYRVVGVLNGMIFPAQNSTESVTTAMQAVETRAEAMGGFYSRITKFTLFFEFPAVRKDYSASLLIFLFVLFCIWCYKQKAEGIKEWYRLCLYTAVVSLAIFFITASPAPYWIIILYPYLFLLMYTNRQCLRFNLILEKAFTSMLFIVYVMSTFWVYGGAQTFEELFLAKWGIIPSGHEFQGVPNISGYLEKIGVGEVMPIVVAICLASIIGIIYVNYPKVRCDEELTEKYTIELQHGFAVVNVLLLFAWYVVNVILIGRY